MYFPKHQIIPNLSTQGGELKYAQEPSTEYSGSYFKTSDGRFYTGKDSTDKPNLPLSLVSTSSNPLSNPEINPTNNKTSFVKLEHNEPRGINMYIEDVDYYRARSIKDRGDAPRPPVKSSPLPTEQEYDKGIYYRYFMKKGNEGLFIEVNLDEYNIFLKEKEIDLLNKQNELLQDNIDIYIKREELFTPKWYERPYITFPAGILTAILAGKLAVSIIN